MGKVRPSVYGLTNAIFQEYAMRDGSVTICAVYKSIMTLIYATHRLYI